MPGRVMGRPGRGAPEPAIFPGPTVDRKLLQPRGRRIRCSFLHDSSVKLTRWLEEEAEQQGGQPEEGEKAEDVGEGGDDDARGDGRIHPEALQEERGPAPARGGLIVQLGRHRAGRLTPEQAEERHLVGQPEIAQRRRNVGGVGVLEDLAQALAASPLQQIPDGVGAGRPRP